MSIQKREHVLAKTYHMIDMKSENIESAGYLKVDLINRNKRLNKEDIHIHTHNTVHTEVGKQKQ